MDFTALGLLIFRLGFAGILAVQHGLPKLLDFSNKMHSFPDPLGIGSMLSLTLTVSAEFFCAVLVLLGLFTRFAAIPVVIAMAVAFFIVHSADPFAKKELAFLFFIAFSGVCATGPGAYSLDTIFRRVR